MTKLQLTLTSILVGIQQTKNLNKINKSDSLIMEDQWQIVQETANKIRISDGSAHIIFTDDLNMSRVTAKFVYKVLFS